MARKKKVSAKIYCCEKCSEWNTCKTKWYRGEKGEEQLCCEACSLYDDCLAAAAKT